MTARLVPARVQATDRIIEPTDAVPRRFIDESSALRRESPVNAMSVDVEEYFQVSAFEKRITKKDWNDSQSRVSHNMDRILQLFDDSGTKATFFTLGWVAERAPNIIRALVSEGHEIASHGYDHARVWTLTPDELLADVTRTKKILEDISGEQVIGYRAPSFSITSETLWAYDVLQEAGYRYSSSIYPISHDHYGFPSAPRFPFRFRSGGMLEIPLTSLLIRNRNWPCAGGGYFRFFPLTYSRWALNRIKSVEKLPAVFYFHPWELDVDQPRVRGIPLITRFRHYVNLGRFEGRLKTILREHQWERLDNVYRPAM